MKKIWIYCTFFLLYGGKNNEKIIKQSPTIFHVSGIVKNIKSTSDSSRSFPLKIYQKCPRLNIESYKYRNLSKTQLDDTARKFINLIRFFAKKNVYGNRRELELSVSIEDTVVFIRMYEEKNKNEQYQYYGVVIYKLYGKLEPDPTEDPIYFARCIEGRKNITVINDTPSLDTNYANEKFAEMCSHYSSVLQCVIK